MLKELSLSPVKWFKVEGSTLWLLIAFHWLAKYLLNMLALASNSVISSFRVAESQAILCERKSSLKHFLGGLKYINLFITIFINSMQHVYITDILKTFPNNLFIGAISNKIQWINILMHNVPKWSDTLKILQICLTISGDYALKG